MSKYKDYISDIEADDNDIVLMLQQIANELAEANRIQRLRLKVLSGVFTKEELEDQS